MNEKTERERREAAISGLVARGATRNVLELMPPDRLQKLVEVITGLDAEGATVTWSKAL